MKKLLLVYAIACAKIVISSAAVEEAAPNYELKAIALPGANGAVALDYFAYDPTTGKVWCQPAISEASW